MFDGAAFAPLSHDKPIQFILADVPFFSVGILSFGVFSASLLLRRVNWLVMCLHLGAIAAFIGSVLDLSQILVRGAEAVNQGTKLGSVGGITTAREVFFSLSFGFQFVFYWAFASQPPVGEVPTPRGIRHSGSWEHWGVTGFIVQWVSLAASLSIPLLQVLYRNVNVFDHKGALYSITGGIQIALSMLFFLKLLHGVCISAPKTFNILPKRKAIILSIPVLTSMLTSMWLAIGNVAEFDFTETVFGRFIQALTFYILIMYTLCIVFILMNEDSNVQEDEGPVEITEKGMSRTLDPIVVETQAQRGDRLRRKSTFRGLPALKFRNSSFQILPPEVSTPVLQTRFGSETERQFSASDAKIDGRESINSKPSRAGSLWRKPSRLFGRRSSTRTGRSAVDGHSNLDLENGSRVDHASRTDSVVALSSPEEARNPASAAIESVSVQSLEWRDTMQSAASKPSGDYRLPSYYVGNPQNVAGDTSQSEMPIPPMPPVPPVPPISVPPSVRSHLSTPASLSSSTTGTQSPVFGLNGIHLPSRRNNVQRMPDESTDDPDYITNVSRFSGGSDVSALLRQQNELDRSIAALRLFSPPMTASGVTTNTDALSVVTESGEGISEVGPPDEDRLSKVVPSATQSVFTLSNFPVPPWGVVTSASSTGFPPLPSASNASSETRRMSMFSAVRGTTSRRSSLAIESQLPNRTLNGRQTPPEEDEASILSPRVYKTPSGQTEYEITSFIGGLSKPAQETGSSPSDSSDSIPSFVTPAEGFTGRASPLRAVIPPPSSYPLANREPVSNVLNVRTVPAPRALPIVPGAPPRPFINSSLPRVGLPSGPHPSKAFGLPPRPRPPPHSPPENNLSPVSEKTDSSDVRKSTNSTGEDGNGNPPAVPS